MLERTRRLAPAPWSLVAGLAVAVVVVIGARARAEPLFPAARDAAPPARDDEEGSGKDEKKSGGTVATDPDEKFVREHLEEYLAAKSVEFADDGRVKILLDFREKKEEQESIFTTRVGHRMKDRFRWTIEDEEWVIGGDTGLRLSDRGLVCLRVWFEDDVEAEMEYLQFVNFSRRHTAAVVFATSKGKALASNFGGQCAYFSGGRRGKAVGKPISVAFNSKAKIKLVVKDGTFEAHRNGRKRSEMPYSTKVFHSGMVGFLWSGSLSAIVPSLKISGKIDYKATARDMKKALKSR